MICTKQYTLIILLPTTKYTELISAFVIFICMALMLHTTIADWFDIVSDWTDHDLYRVHKNSVHNTILWSVVFLGLYLYNRDQVRRSGYELELIDLFLIGRVLFSFGYTIGTVIGHQSLRSVGFGLTISSIFMLTSQIFGLGM